ncbi:MAG TPA: UDP-N-acetylmuramate:L-alanyl-gamma-D-glutamyl-meso-diaminopimelate ligase [Acidobacteriaceae bacterium]|nr:UDP-N-acetylmuramate:L-alanyl-gamma-D-glutamyl-meso-diaminopimelate ligase [Acidobacteriaceae bacterium]
MPNSPNPRHVHLIGICGTAMASLAGLLQLSGCRVTGSDNAIYPPMSDVLAGLGIPILQPYAAFNLQPKPDCIIVGNAISRGNVELEYALDQKISIRSMAQTIYETVLQGRESLVVAGTHGKTTTTSMLAWIYEVAGQKNPDWTPSFLIGGVAENFGTSFALRPTRPFIIEGDEYDTAFFDKGPKFLHYFPDALILTHVEYDHADIYLDLEAVRTSFKRLVNLVPRRGRIIAFDGSANVTQCVAGAFCPVERYGFAADSYWHVSDFSTVGERSLWRVDRKALPWMEFEMPFVGEHNVLNATAAAALAAGQGVPNEAIRKALASFRSVRRRLEVCAEIAGITIIDDFAHHPTAIRETLRALQARYPGRRLWAVLEPRSNTLRRNIFEKELVESLAMANEVILAAVYQPVKIPAEQLLHADKVVASLNDRAIPAILLPDADAIVAHLAGQLRSGDVIAILSNGAFGDIYHKLPQRLRQQQSEG